MPIDPRQFDQEARIKELERKLELLQSLLRDKTTFEKPVQVLDGRNWQFGKGTGSKLGTETTQKLGFFNTTPASQQSKISDPSGGGTQDSEARTAINSIIDALEAFGFTASS